ncbi:MAG: methylated-DNA--[protein]-cysteine S-methyltransferase [Verrucomicrobia bacterium]|nr:methylated-DNA--[protein]-cysteine S-methyltransferase [Verrucomicrobiota bacterium]
MDNLRAFDIVIADRSLVLRAGNLLVVAHHDGKALHRLELRSTDVSPVKDRHGMERVASRQARPTCPIEETLLDEMRRYFGGERVRFSIPLADVPATVFQRAVWDALLAIPYGETRSYSAVARAIGKPNAARAVGAACGANPIPIIIPCHRVIAEDGGLGGYSASLKWKLAGLVLEGARLGRQRQPG